MDVVTQGHEPVVGAAGFEPATFRSQSGCATRLRYAPKGFESSLAN